MKALVTGGQGFIGSHLVDRLVSDGHEVVVIDNGLCGDNTNNAADYRGLDIREDSTDLWRFVNHLKPDVVFHLAAIARTPWCIGDPVGCYDTNVQGSAHVLEAARGNAKRVVMASSNVVYAAMTPYRTSKEAMEALTAAYVETYGLNALCLRFSNVYGTRQREDGPSPNVFAALRKAKKETGHIEITGDGEQSRDFTHVSDIVEGLIAAAKSGYVGEPIDLCTGINTSLNSVAKHFNCPVKYIPERHGDIKHIVQDASRARNILGWSAKVPLAEGIKDCL